MTSDVTADVLDMTEEGLAQLREEAKQWTLQEEDVLSYAQFGQVAVKFFEDRNNKKYKVDAEHADAKSAVHPI